MNTTVKATNKEHLRLIIKHEIGLNGNQCDLNFIDVTSVKNMESLFYETNFNGNISSWDVSNIENMEFTFYFSHFNGNISKWNTANVEDMKCMFSSAKFDGDISKWDVSKVKDMDFMFYYSKFTKDLSAWRPFKLDKVDQIFDSCDAPIPYWYNFDNKKQRTMAINNYLLHDTLLEELDNKNPITKRLKI